MSREERATRDQTAHDLKNQLGVVLGFAELLLTELPADDPRRPDLAEMREAARTALALAHRLAAGHHGTRGNGR